MIQIPVKDPTSIAEDYATLHCPACGGGNLHHHTVVVGMRDAEDKPGTIYEIHPSGTLVTERSASGFLGRRNDVRIELWCEHCPAVHELHIVQHKGETRMSFERCADREEGTEWQL